MSATPSKDTIARLLQLCGSAQVEHRQRACEIVGDLASEGALVATRAALAPLAERAGRHAALSAVASFIAAGASAWCHLSHQPIALTLTVGAIATALLLSAARATRHQGAADSALDALGPLPDVGPMSRQIVERLCAGELARPAALENLDAQPLFRAHLALARAFAVQQRRARR